MVYWIVDEAGAVTRSRTLPIGAVVATAARGDESPLLHCLGLDPVPTPQVVQPLPGQCWPDPSCHSGEQAEGQTPGVEC